MTYLKYAFNWWSGILGWVVVGFFGVLIVTCAGCDENEYMRQKRAVRAAAATQPHCPCEFANRSVYP